MQLFYRGIAYETSNQSVNIQETTQMAHFLGRTYPMKRATVAERHSSPQPLRYRGVPYEG